MSYEGSVQCICPNGHYFERDCYDSQYACTEKDCGSEAVWVNAIDDTNCDSVGIIPFQLLVEKFRIAEEQYETCNLGHPHLVKPAIFRVPSEEETVPLRHWSNPKTDKLEPLSTIQWTR